MLELRPQITLTGNTLTLNDLLSSSQGVSADDLATPIAEAPPLGNAQTWKRDDLAKRLPPGLKTGTVDWTGANACEVDRPAAQCNRARRAQPDHRRDPPAISPPTATSPSSRRRTSTRS